MKKLSIFLIFIFSIQLVSACTCLPPLEVSEEFAKSKQVFLGTVVEKTDIESLDEVMTVKVQLEKVWKGDALKPMKLVNTSLHSSSCGYTFKKDKKYLIYTWEQEGKEIVSKCSRTAQYEAAELDLFELGYVAPEEAKKEIVFVTIWKWFVGIFE